RMSPADELPPVLGDPTVQSLSRELGKQGSRSSPTFHAKISARLPLVKQTQEQVKQLETQLTEAS
ncbi:MAG: hypothetical protein IPG76_21645, partial [Acidobacteria bacterium]|nr:hypothetical protein [Acidobacteriota bacterium]